MRARVARAGPTLAAVSSFPVGPRSGHGCGARTSERAAHPAAGKGLPLTAGCAAASLYRPRRPQATALYCLVEAHYEEVKGQWEDRFERRYGHWRGFVEGVVMRYLDCGAFEAGFARVRCRDCHADYLVACSCKGRGLCPSCGAKRAAAFAVFLQDEVLEAVGHGLWTFSIPKMIRPCFLHHRELLGRLCRAAWETASELMAAAAGEVDGFRTGMVVAAQTAGDALGLHPHLHALVPRGGGASDGAWVPVPFVDPGAAELLFRDKALSFLRAEGMLSEERTELLLSWQHRTGLLRRCAACDQPWPAGGRRPSCPHSSSAAPSLRPPRPRPQTAAQRQVFGRLQRQGGARKRGRPRATRPVHQETAAEPRADALERGRPRGRVHPQAQGRSTRCPGAPRPPRLLQVRRRDAEHHRHPRPRRHQDDPRASPQEETDRPPAPPNAAGSLEVAS